MNTFLHTFFTCSRLTQTTGQQSAAPNEPTDINPACADSTFTSRWNYQSINWLPLMTSYVLSSCSRHIFLFALCRANCISTTRLLPDAINTLNTHLTVSMTTNTDSTTSQHWVAQVEAAMIGWEPAGDETLMSSLDQMTCVSGYGFKCCEIKVYLFKQPMCREKSRFAQFETRSNSKQQQLIWTWRAAEKKNYN